jgi:hypothetical protein
MSPVDPDPNERIEPLDPALAAVLSGERGSRPAPDGSRERVLARLEATLGGGLFPHAAPPAASPASSSPSWLTRGLPLLTLVAGVAIGAAWSPRAKRPVALPAAPPASVAPATPSRVGEVDGDKGGDQGGERGTGSARATPSSPTSSSSVSPTTSNEPASAPRPSADTADALGQERTLLDGARTALVRRDGPRALSLLDKHRARYPNGALSEERDALAVQALALEGRTDDARARAEAFARRYPSSLLLPSVKSAVGTSQGKP